MVTCAVRSLSSGSPIEFSNVGPLTRPGCSWRSDSACTREEREHRAGEARAGDADRAVADGVSGFRMAQTIW